jgi:hypothetical protein
MPHPRRGAGDTLEYLQRFYRTTPRRQAGGIGHPRRCQPCAAIPATAAPRGTLWRHPNAVGTCGDKTLPQQPLCNVRASRQRHPRTGPPRRPVNQPIHRRPRSHSCTSTGRTTTPQRERDSPGRSVLSCLAPAIERQISALITS